MTLDPCSANPVPAVAADSRPGRSCFQAFHLAGWAPGAPCQTLDVAEVEEMGIFAHNVADHEELIRRIFALLTGA